MRPTFVSPRRAALSFVLGAALALPAHASASSFAPSARERSQEQLTEGDADADKGDWNAAISKYRAAYYSLPPDDQASYFGSMPVRKAMRAYEQRISQEQDPNKRRALLERQRVFLEEFLDAVAVKQSAAEEVGEDIIAELQQTRGSIDAALEKPKPAEPVRTDDTTTSERAPTTIDDDFGDIDPGTSTDSPQPRDRLGLGLTIGGSALVATGLGLLGVYVFTVSEARSNLRDDPSFPDPDGYLAGEKATFRPYLIVGSVVAAAGLGMAIGGIVHLVLHRRRAKSRDTAFQLSPILSPTTTGLVLHRRF